MKTLKKNEREDNISVRISLLFAIVVLLSTFGLPKANAYPIIIEIEATVNGVADYGPGVGYLEGKIDVGDIITGTYTYESTTPDSSPSDPVQGNYWHYEPPAGISLTVGGFEFVTDPCNVEFWVFIRNNNLSGDDIYGIESRNNLTLSNGTSVQSITWHLNDPTANALSSDALPVTAPILDQWDENVLRLRTDRVFLIDAHVTSVEVIPEPATVFLFGSGFLLLRKRK